MDTGEEHQEIMRSDVEIMDGVGESLTGSIKHDRTSDKMSLSRRLCSRKTDQNFIVFILQMVIIFVVIGVSLVNLTLEISNRALWISLLSACMGYALPNPTLYKAPHHNVRDSAQ